MHTRKKHKFSKNSQFWGQKTRKFFQKNHCLYELPYKDIREITNDLESNPYKNFLKN
jgi:hypothetical protein